MFRSTRTFSYAVQYRARLVKSEQTCLKCRKWFDCTTEIRALLDTAAERQARGETGVPITDCTCSHCGESQITIMPGKYDGLQAARPTTQRYQFAPANISRTIAKPLTKISKRGLAKADRAINNASKI